jgi:hypothetical protein
VEIQYAFHTFGSPDGPNVQSLVKFTEQVSASSIRIGRAAISPTASWQLQYTRKVAGKRAPHYKKSHFTKSCHSDAKRSGGKGNPLPSKLSARRGHVIQWCPPP